MDFLLSLSARAKEKLAKASLPDSLNKSVMYADQGLSEEDVSHLRNSSLDTSAAYPLHLLA